MTFEEFVVARLRPLLRMAHAICRDAVLAEDLVQDVLIKVQGRWDQISALDIPEAYIRRMLVNEFLSSRRRAARTVPTALVEPTLEPDHADALVERAALSSEIARLPARQQVVLALRYHEGLTDDEIARAIGCRVGTVRGYLSRALKALRIQLDSSLPSEPRGPAR